MKDPEQYGKYELIVGITKEEPERYVEEMLRDVLAFAEREQIPREKVCGLLRKWTEAEGVVPTDAP